MRKAAFLCLFTLVALFAVGDTDDDWSIKVNGRVTEEKARIEGAVVSLHKNNRLMQEVVTSQNGKFIFVLKPGNDYMIEVAKLGYARKMIAFSTKNVPQDKVGAGFPEFPVEFILFKEVEGVNTDVLDQPVGKIGYSPIADDFTIDIDYYKSIRADLILMNKNLKFAANRMEKEERLASKVTLEREDRTDDDIIYYTTPIGDFDNSVIPVIVVEANSHVREESVQWSDRQGVDIRTGLELLDQKRMRLRKQLKHLPGMLVSTNTYNDGNKEILIRIINKADLYIEYKRVIQPWGSKFYFKDDTSITAHIFKLESDLEALVQSRVYMF